MSVSVEYLLVIFGMFLVTFIPRWTPLFLLSGRDLPLWLRDFLDLVPAAILSALLVPALVTDGDPRAFDLFRPEFFVALPTLAFALKTRSLGGTVIFGMLLYWLAGKFF